MNYQSYLESQDRMKTIECDECKNEFLFANDIVKEDEVRIHNNSIKLTYFTCPHCFKVFPVLIDTIKSLSLKSAYVHQLGVIEHLTKRKKPTEKAIERANKYKRLLEKEYSYISKAYNGVFYQKDKKETGDHDH